MLKLIAALLFLIIPDRLETPVDTIEINTTDSPVTGEYRFKQILLWKRQGGGAIQHVSDWGMVDTWHPQLWTTKDRNYPIRMAVIIDGQLIVLKSHKLLVTRGFEDPEELDRQTFPLDCRESVFDLRRTP